MIFFETISLYLTDTKNTYVLKIHTMVRLKAAHMAIKTNYFHNITNKFGDGDFYLIEAVFFHHITIQEGEEGTLLLFFNNCYLYNDQ